MIFITVGTHPQQFNRLLKKIDELIEKGIIKDTVFAQIGTSTYKPKKYDYKKVLTLDNFDEMMRKSDLIITHGGEGNIGKGIQFKKKMIMIPRLKDYAEHTNNHQLEIVKTISKENMALAVYDLDNLEKTIIKIKKFTPNFSHGNEKLIKILEKFIENMGN